ncbi:dihydrofolate reductase family protein [Georgenia sp. AZ-5]|uniref:dihydrofolate reductase family protein n=1 Tax=Georgenia sp. AZ-5 TaxID=3367526 RepID=UPI003753EC0E
MRRPRVVTYSLASVDGRLAPAPGVVLLEGDPRWEAITRGIGDPYAWVLRTHDPQALLEGSGSFVRESAADTDGGAVVGPAAEPFLPARLLQAPGRRWFVVVDGRGRVDLRFAEWPDEAWAGWHALVLTSRAASAGHLARLRERGIPYVVVGERRVDLPAALGLLKERLGVSTLVCTGGGRLGGALLRAGVVDEVDVEVLPALIGGRGTPALFDAPPLQAGEWPTSLELLSSENVGGRLRLRYRVLGTAAPEADEAG